jgi:hypothetical protein
MTLTDDFAISTAKVISWTGPAHGTAVAAEYYKVIELHRHLMDLADDPAWVGNDIMDIIKDSPSDRQGIDNIIALTNGYTITQEAVEHLYDGSIIMNDGDDIWDSIVVLCDTDTDLEVRIIQDGAVISPLLTTGNSFWNNIVGGGPVNPGLNPVANAGISMQFLLKVRTGGVDIDAKSCVGYTRVWGKTFSEFRVNATARGNNSLPLTFRNDLNNTTVVGTVAGWTTITNTTEGFAQIDVEADAVLEDFYSEWNIAGFTKNQFYERMKWLTRSGEIANDIYGLDGELFRGITHEVAVGTPTGTFSAFEGVSWSTGTGQMLAIDSTTAATKMWIQLLTGTAPTTQVITGVSTATVTATGFTQRTISSPFVGASTGTAIIGAYGFGIEASDLSSSDTVFDLTNAPLNAPNNVIFSINGVVIGEDRLLVTNRGYKFKYDTEAAFEPEKGETITFSTPAGTAKLNDIIDDGTTGWMYIGPILSGSAPTDNTTMLGGTSGFTGAVDGAVTNAIDLGQMSNLALVDGASVGTIQMAANIPTDTPTSGNIRIERTSGVYTLNAYDSYATDTFTLTNSATDFSGDPALAGDNVFVVYSDKLTTSDPETFTVVYNVDRTVFVRVRDGDSSPIKPVETTGTIGSAGGSATITRQADD